jgi:hypothetical protein
MNINNTPKSNKKLSESIISIFFILLAIIMIATNPTEDRFKNYIKERLKKEAREKGNFSGAVMELFAGPTSWIAGSSTKRKNYIFFSSYTVTIMDEEFSYIGIFNNFIELK